MSEKRRCPQCGAEVPDDAAEGLCPKCLRQAIQESGGPCISTANSVQPLRQAVVDTKYSLVEGEDYYSEGEMIIFTARYHLRRGYCCENGCRHCPYGENGS